MANNYAHAAALLGPLNDKHVEWIKHMLLDMVEFDPETWREYPDDVEVPDGIDTVEGPRLRVWAWQENVDYADCLEEPDEWSVDLGFDYSLEEEEDGHYLYIHDNGEYINGDAVAFMVYQLFNAVGPVDNVTKQWGMEIAYTCSKHRPGEFGGAAFAVSVEGMEWMSTARWLSDRVEGPTIVDPHYQRGPRTVSPASPAESPLQKLVTALNAMPEPLDRLNALETLNGELKFCTRCGFDRAEGEVCHCENDE